jgi:hypothetical protein
MSTTSITRCDVCHKEIKDYKSIHRLEFNRLSLMSKPYFSYDICPECLNNVLYCFGEHYTPPKPKKGKKK